MPTTTPTGVAAWLNRGYTAHEHLRTFALINMNGRMYDPALGRMLSPDNYAGLDGTTQSYNRYSYVQNNPLKYTDPTGEFLIPLLMVAASVVTATVAIVAVTAIVVASVYSNPILYSTINLTTDAVSAAFSGGLDFGNNARRDKAWSNIDPTGRWSKTNKGLQIAAGLFVTNPNLSAQEQENELKSRFTWQLPQEILGYNAAQLDNTFDGVEDVSYFDGATIVRSKVGSALEKDGIFTLGSYIHGSSLLPKDLSGKNTTLLLHEYGHYIQSQKFGPRYLPFFALPSIISAGFFNSRHDGFYTEQGANYYGNEYRAKYYPGVIWNTKFGLDTPNNFLDEFLLRYQKGY